jgi:hypothetical protein
MDKAISGHAKKRHPKIRCEVEDHLQALMFKVGHDAGKEANL